MSKNIVHYNLDKIASLEADINIIYGERSNGKSYQVKHKRAVEKFIKTGRRFILLRRWKDEVTTEKVEQYFQDVDITKLTNGKYNAIIMYRRVLYLSVYDFELNKNIKGERIGYVMALSQEQNYAGASFLDVDDIIFEEFMSRNSYLSNEPTKLMNLYSTVDRKRGTTKIWMVGNSITRICPYLTDWGLQEDIARQKQGTIFTKDVDAGEGDIVKIAVEYCQSTGVSSHTIGIHKDMLNKGTWQVNPQPHLPKSKKEYTTLFRFGFQYQSFRFLCERLLDNETYEQCFFIYPYEDEFNEETLVISDEVRQSKLWQRNVYNISINNERLKLWLDDFREQNIFYATDLCGTDFKQAIDFDIRK